MVADSDAPPDTIRTQLTRRKVIPWALGYLAGSWVLLQVIALLAEPFGWPESRVVRTATVVLATGFFMVLVLAWYHGEHGRQRPRATELGLLSILSTAAIAGGLIAWRAQPGASGAAASGAAVPAVTNSIAVLPFADMSPEKDQGYFTDGITEEILNVLAGIDGLQVAARTSSFQFKDHNLDMREIGRRLNVAHVLEGSIQKSGDRVRITAQLIDSRNGFHLWSDRWDKTLTDVFAIEDEIARGIANVLRQKLSLDVGATRERQRVDPAAHDLYLRAIGLTHDGSEASLKQALSHFRQALRLEPDYADAHAGIAYAYMNLADAYMEPRLAYPLAMDAAKRALAIDSTNAVGLAGLGYASLHAERDLPYALELTRRAVRHNPNSVEALFLNSNLACALGSVEEGLALVRRARQLDPYALVLMWEEEICLIMAGDFDQVIEIHSRMKQVAPDFAYLDDFAAVAWRGKGDLQRALAEYDHVAPGLATTYGKAITLARLGRTEEARTLLKELESEARRRYVSPSLVAAVHGQLGDIPSALRWIEQADQSGDLLARYFINGNPDFQPLAKNPQTAARIKAFLRN